MQRKVTIRSDALFIIELTKQETQAFPRVYITVLGEEFSLDSFNFGCSTD